MSEIVELRYELERSKNLVIKTYKELENQEKSYLESAIKIYENLKAKGIEIPDWFFNDMGEADFGFTTENDGYDCYALGFKWNTNSFAKFDNDYCWIFSNLFMYFNTLEGVDYTDMNTTTNPYGADSGDVDDLNDAKALRGYIDNVYGSMLDAMAKYPAERKAWFEKVNAWLKEIDLGIGESKKVTCVVNKILEGADIKRVLSEAVADKKELPCEFYITGPGEEYMNSCTTYAPDVNWPPRWKGSKTSTMGAPGDIIYISHIELPTNPIYWRNSGDASLYSKGSVVKFVIPENAKGKGLLYIDVVRANDPGSDDIFLYIDLAKSKGWVKDIKFVR